MKTKKSAKKEKRHAALLARKGHRVAPVQPVGILAGNAHPGAGVHADTPQLTERHYRGHIWSPAHQAHKYRYVDDAGVEHLTDERPAFLDTVEVE